MLLPRDIFARCRVVETNVNVVGTALTQVCILNPDRVCLFISQEEGGTYIATTNPTGGSDQGITIAANPGFLLLTIDRHFALVGQAWFVSSTIAPGGDVNVIECIMDHPEGMPGLDGRRDMYAGAKKQCPPTPNMDKLAGIINRLTIRVFTPFNYKG